MKAVFGVSVLLVGIALLGLTPSPGSAAEQTRGLGVRCSSTEALAEIGGKIEGVITDPATLKTAGMTTAQAGDRLLIIRIATNAVKVENLRSGSTIKLGYGYGGGTSDGSGYLGRLSTDKDGKLILVTMTP